MPELILTEDERDAKDYVIHVMLKGLTASEPCDESFTDDDFKLPKWFDEESFVRGQKYFTDNRAGIMMSNLYGLFSLICEPMGAKILDRTEMSSTPATAKKRYVSTTLHMLSWFQDELKPGSKSWESLKRVRKMHLHASRSAGKNKVGMISQCAMAMTKFGFMGYALVRPHMLGIKHDNDEDREAYIHLWAVLGYMLGIKDEFNMCLHRLAVVEIICRIFIRYAFIPFLQLETPAFTRLGRAFIEGMSVFIPFSSYESRLFLARRLAGIPGYQYDVDLTRETFQRQIFSPSEINQFIEQFQNTPGHEYRRNFVFNEKMFLLDIRRIDDLKKGEGDENFGHYTTLDSNNNDSLKYEDDTNKLMEFLDLKHPSELLITQVEDDAIRTYLNDRKFKELSSRDQLLVKMGIHHATWVGRRFTKPLYEGTLSCYLYLMEKFQNNQK